MAENNDIEVLPISQDTPPAQGSESQPPADPEPESTDPGTEPQPEGGENQPQHSEENQPGNADDPSGQQPENKPSRAERRIQQLISKMKETTQPQTPSGNRNPGAQTPSPFLSPEEIEEGAIDPAVLEQRINQRVQSEVQSEVQKALQSERATAEYNSAVREHQTDLDTITDIDPNVEKLAVKQYEAVNYQINPMTGQKMFIPAVKFSEIVKSITESLGAAAESVAEGNRQYAHSVSQNQAIPSGGNVPNSQKVKDDTTDFAAFEKAYGSKK